MTPVARARDVAAGYDGLVLDAYGVLVDSAGALPGAPEFVQWLRDEDRPFVVVTNDASRSVEAVAARLRANDIPVPSEAVFTSGLLLGPYFAEHGLSGARTLVLGPADSFDYVRQAGGDPIDHVTAAEVGFDVLVIGDESGYPLLEAVDDALGPLVAAFESGRPPRLVVPNPDLVYPRPGRKLGLASGGIAALFESVLQSRFGEEPRARFDRLGKPGAALFRAARRHLGGGRLVMFGDTPHTDLAGARAAGLDDALVLTGVTSSAEGIHPTPAWVIRDLT